jgi:hypothetical protein
MNFLQWLFGIKPKKKEKPKIKEHYKKRDDNRYIPFPGTDPFDIHYRSNNDNDYLDNVPAPETNNDFDGFGGGSGGGGGATSSWDDNSSSFGSSDSGGCDSGGGDGGGGGD